MVFDSDGRIALCAKDSPEYDQYVQSGDLKVIKAMRGKRA